MRGILGCRLRLYRLYLLVALSVFSMQAFAAKVKLDPSNWGAEAGEKCVSCHTKASSGLTKQWQDSAHKTAGVNCMDCHQAESAEPDAIEHEGYVIATVVSPKDCGRCHSAEFKQQEGSVHAEAVALIADKLPAMTENVSGAAIEAAGCAQCHGSVLKVRGDGSLDPATWPNSGIGRVNPDGSKVLARPVMDGIASLKRRRASLPPAFAVIQGRILPTPRCLRLPSTACCMTRIAMK